MDPIIVAEFIYIISAVLCAVGYPLQQAYKKVSCSRLRELKYQITYGQIVIGFMFGLVPVLNTVISLFCILYTIEELQKKLDTIKVFAPKNDE